MHLFIQLLPHELSGIKSFGMDPKLVQLIFELGTFSERMGVTFEVEPVSTRVLKVEYPDENTFIVLRLGYGERFTDWKEPEEDALTRALRQNAAKTQSIGRSQRVPPIYKREPDDWTKLKDRMAKKAMWESVKPQGVAPEPDPDPKDEEESMTLYRRLVAKFRSY